MSATTEDIITRRRGLEVGTLGVAAAAVLYAGILLIADASGYADEGVDSADVKFLGVCQQGYDNSAGANGALNCEFRRTGQFRFLSAGLSADDVGKPVYIIDNQTVGLASHADVGSYVYVGIITEVESATRCWVDIRPGEADPARRTFQVDVAGPDTDAIDLSTAAASEYCLNQPGTDISVLDVKSVLAIVSSTGAPASPMRKVATTHWTLSAGVVTTVGDESANRLVITFDGVLNV